MYKRLLALLLALLTVLTLIPMQALAETGAPAEQLEDIFYVKPSLEGKYTKEDMQEQLSKETSSALYASSPTYYTSISSAAKAVRKAMVNRKSTITIGWKTTTPIQYQYQFQEWYDNMFEKIIAHTGKPNEGDYILWQVTGFIAYAPVNVGTSGSYYLQNITLEMTYDTTASQEAWVDDKIDDLIDELDLKNGDPEYVRFKRLYDWVCSNITYDYYHLERVEAGDTSYMLHHTAYGGLKYGTCVCEGYALIIYRVALEMGLDARLVAGCMVNGSPTHGWNIVQIGKYYYNVDSTWDAGYTNSGYMSFMENQYDFNYSGSYYSPHDRDPDYNSSAFHKEYPMSPSSLPADYAAPKFTTQPKSVKVLDGDTVKITAKGTDTSLKYQWYYKDKGDSKFSKSSITSSTYKCTMTEAKDGRQVFCRITDSYGIDMDSKTVKITLGEAVKITKQPSGDAAGDGEKVSTKVTATGDGLKYQWYYKNPGSSSYKKSSLTSKTYKCTMTEKISGRKVYCVVKDQFGNSVKSKTVTLSMIDITSQPKSKDGDVGDKLTAKVKAVGEGLKYQWYYKDDGASKYSKSSVTKSTYSMTLTKAKAGRRLYCVISDKYGNKVKTNTIIFDID